MKFKLRELPSVPETGSKLFYPPSEGRYCYILGKFYKPLATNLVVRKREKRIQTTNLIFLQWIYYLSTFCENLKMPVTDG
jgi:hypothetical protein